MGSFHRAAKRDVRRTSGGESFDRAIESESGATKRPSKCFRWRSRMCLGTCPRHTER